MTFKETIEKHPSYLKKGVQWLCNRFGVSEKEVKELKDEYRKTSISKSCTHFSKIEKEKENEIVVIEGPMTIEELCSKYKIDLKKYSVNDYWVKTLSSGLLEYSLHPVIKKGMDKEEFKMFVNSYIPPKYDWNIKQRNNHTPCSIIVNKQDVHFNKQSLEGKNTLEERFEDYEKSVIESVEKVNMLHSVDEIVYIIGSDHFNSEYTGTTVKGTPQQNISNYVETFRKVCSHEVLMINYFLSRANKVKIFYLPGNHDAFVSYHMSEWLKAFFKKVDRVEVCAEFEYTKYFSLFDSAFCINHGDVQKPEQLASNFPLMYKKGFALADWHYILTGDKHTELVKDINGIKFHRLAAISKAKGNYEKHNGYTTSKNEVTTMVVEEGKGINMILYS